MKAFLILEDGHVFTGTSIGSAREVIIVVVAQESKQPGMGSAIGGGAEGMMGGKSRGKDAVLSKFTVVLGILFAVLCLGISITISIFSSIGMAFPPKDVIS